MINRGVFFDTVRTNPFPGSLGQDQVSGMNYILDVWEASFEGQDLRWLAYPLATTMWETSSTMQPIEEYGKGEGMEYGTPDKTTGETYYGRGYVQLTWRSNYARADQELAMHDEDSCEWHADNALKPEVAAAIMFAGMFEGWFRKSSDGKAQTLDRYFNDVTDDPYGAREIINGDKSKVPSWSSGVSIGNMIAGYHRAFLVALELAYTPDDLKPLPEEPVVTVIISAPPGVRVDVQVVEGD